MFHRVDFLLKDFFTFVHYSVWSAWMSVHHTCACCFGGQKQASDPLQTEHLDHCLLSSTDPTCTIMLSCEYWGPNPGPVEE